MTTWIAIAVLGWVVVSIVVSLAVGGMIRLADARQVTQPLASSKVRPLRTRAARATALPQRTAPVEQDVAQPLRKAS